MAGQDVLAIHKAFVAGDLAALRGALGDPPDFPNSPGPPAIGDSLLEYAIYWSPLEFVATLLGLGIDANYPDIGFPAVLAALTTERKDRMALVSLLLQHGADPDRRGVNGYTALHWAALADDAAMVRLLLEHGADPGVRTGIDEDQTPLEAIAGRDETAASVLLRKAMGEV